MIICESCKDKKKFLELIDCIGLNKCDEHGDYKFYKTGLEEFCEVCAEEKGICQICGKKPKGKNKLVTKKTYKPNFTTLFLK